MSDGSDSDRTLDYYKSIFESSLDAILVTHPDGTILYANSAAEELFGYTQEEIYELSWKGLVDIKDPQLQVLLDEYSGSGKAKGELALIKKDGQNSNLKYPPTSSKTKVGIY